MSKLEELINELCPNGVEYKPLWAITIWDKKFASVDKAKQLKVNSFKHVSANYLKKNISDNGTIKLLSTGLFDGFADENIVEKYINEAEVITLPSGGTANIKYYNGLFVDSGNLLATSADKLKYNLKYLYYYLLTKNSYIQSQYRGANVQHPDMNKILEILTPVPPLEVQNEIVQILDNFTELTTELTTELIARKKQYEYYRDQLLTFDDDIHKTKLGKLIKELCPNGVEYKPLWLLTAWDKKFNGVDKSMQRKVCNYKYFLSSDFDKVEDPTGNILYLSTGTNTNMRYTTKELAGDYLAYGEIVCIPWGGTPNVKYHKGYFVTGDNRIATSLDTNVLNNKFLYYCLTYNIRTIASYYRGSGIKHPNMKSVLGLLIPVPPIEVQNEFVSILDRFDKLCNDISEGLPAEIEARKKQYEYYRDKLLSFKELKKEPSCE